MREEQPTYWYALYAKSNQQLKVCEMLNGVEGIAAYVPTKKAKRTHARKTVEKDIPIIPTYVFFFCDDAELRFVRNLPGVSQIVRKFVHTGEYIRIPDSQIRNIREAATVDPDGITFQHSRLPFRQGMTVRITDGPFKGIDGVINRIDETKAKQTIYLLLADLGYATIEVDARYLKEI